MSDRARRRWMILGIASAVLNVFLIGFLAGRLVLGPSSCGARGFGHGPRGGGAQKYVRPEDRAALREQLRQIKSARAAVRTALEREPYDRAQLDAALAKLREHSAALQLDMHRMLLDGAGKLNADQRKRLAESRLLRPALGPGPDR